MKTRVQYCFSELNEHLKSCVSSPPCRDVGLAPCKARLCTNGCTIFTGLITYMYMYMYMYMCQCMQQLS